MSDKPILIMPTPAPVNRASAGTRSGDKIKPPSKAAQRERLDSQWDDLLSAFSNVQVTSDDVDPQQVIVLQVAGSIEGFQSAVRDIAGMEWLADFDADIQKPAPGFLLDGTEPSELDGRLFVVASNQKRAKQLVSVWKLWHNAGANKLSRKLAPYARAFEYLHEVRLWGPKDRVQTTGVVAYWEKGLFSREPHIRFEAELWYRAKPGLRAAAYAHLRSRVEAAGGRCVTRVTVEQIDYDGVLIELPASAVRAVIDDLNDSRGSTILRLIDVKYYSPIGQASIMPIDDGTIVTPPDRPAPNCDPVVALLDGLPLENHAALQGRLVVDDPDSLAATYQAFEHRHGTAMASLIAHGEYDGNEASLGSKVYVRPIMAPGLPDDRGKREETYPPNQLIVDLVHRAVRRMFDGEGAIPPQAPGVKVVNLSIGDRWQLFDRHLSPLARLLDWLAFTYNVLFVVSAGNPGDEITIPAPPTSIGNMPDDDLRSHTLRSMWHQRVQRRLLAPAESINALTVGALHAQVGPQGNAGALIDPLRGAALPSPAMPVASGFRRSVKPEILVRGGRLHMEKPLFTVGATSTTLKTSGAASQPGQLVAACDPTGNSNSKAIRLCGSSNAAALTTRRAAQMIERLRELQAGPGGAAITDKHIAAILKAMLVHGASWGDNQELLNRVFDGPDNGQQRRWWIKRACAQFFGYGPADFDRGTVCTDQRVIVLGCGELRAEEGHVYKVPLPPTLGAQTVKRRLTLTLAWFTPIKPRHRNYGLADLWFVPPESHLRVSRQDSDHHSVKRGTIQHEVLEGSDAVPIADGDTMPIQVNCRSDAGAGLYAAVPYALLVSLETANPLAASIYAQVKAKIEALHVPVQVRSVIGPQSRSR